MYLVQNAWKSITRNKPRNILMGIVILVIVISSCVSLSIRQAAETVKESTLDSLTITATLSFDRSKAMTDMQASGSFDKSNFSKSSLTESSLTLDDYMTYTAAQSDGDSYYYSTTASLDASGDLTPYGDSDSSSTTSSSTTSSNSNAMNGAGGMGMDSGKGSMVVNGDFQITGYSSYNSMLSMFGEDGTYAISDGEMFDETSSDLTCIISDELALFNDLSVGDTITLANPNNEEETYELTISGIYTNSASSEGSQTFSMSDPANNIYMNNTALNAIIDASAETNADSDSSDTALTSQLNFTYTFATSENYEKFATEVYNLGLSEDYTVSSQDLATFESSLSPLETLSKMAGWFFLVVLGVGGIILIVLNIFNLRERKYEVGVLTAIGMKKKNVALQFVIELFIVTFMTIIIGTGIGAVASVPVANVLLENQVTQSESSTSTVNENFGFKDSGTTGTTGTTGTDAGQGNMKGQSIAAPTAAVSYVSSVSSATNFTVVLQLIGVGLLLTIISSLAALVSIMRYEPLKILSSRS